MPEGIKFIYSYGDIMSIVEEEEEDNSFIMMVGRDNPIFKNRSMKFYHLKGETLIMHKLPTVPDSVIVCDGCNNLILDDEVGLLMLEKDHCWGTQCKSCIKEYFSTLPVVKGEN